MAMTKSQKMILNELAECLQESSLLAFQIINDVPGATDYEKSERKNRLTAILGKAAQWVGALKEDA